MLAPYAKLKPALPRSGGGTLVLRMSFIRTLNTPLDLADRNASPTIIAARRLSPSRNPTNPSSLFRPRFPLPFS
jgi:hypothetical protein